MNILNDAPTDPRVSGLLYERVRVFLNKKLEPFALNSADVYINTVDDPINQRMVSSQSLYEEAIDSLERGSEPTYVQGITYVFSCRGRLSRRIACANHHWMMSRK